MYNQRSYELGATGSVIRELFEYGKQRKKEIGADKVFDFSIGNPSVPAPSIVNETLIDLITNKDATVLHGYTSSSGDNDVKKSIASYLNKKYDVDASYDLVYLTCGAAASLTISLKSLLNEGEEAIVFAPFFPEYRVFVQNALGKLVVCGYEEKTFLPDFKDFESKINEKTKCVIINSPNNPTGVVYSSEVIAKLAKILNDKQNEYQHDIYLISDEPYRELVYGDVQVPFVTKYYNNTLICYSFSKSLSLPGERIGYILVSSKCNKAREVFSSICGAGRSLGFVCAPTLFQFLIPSCLGYTSDIKVYEENRDILYEELTKYGYEVVKPEGAFYLFVKALEEDAIKFSEYAKKYELLLVPSDSFGCKGYLRISYCVSKKQVLDSLSAFKKLIEEYKDNKYLLDK